MSTEEQALDRKSLRLERRKQLAESFSVEGNHRASVFSAVVGIGDSSLWAAVADGRLPKPLKLGSRTSVWSGELIQQVKQNGFAPVGTFSAEVSK